MKNEEPVGPVFDAQAAQDKGPVDLAGLGSMAIPTA